MIILHLNEGGGPDSTPDPRAEHPGVGSGNYPRDEEKTPRQLRQEEASKRVMDAKVGETLEFEGIKVEFQQDTDYPDTDKVIYTYSFVRPNFPGVQYPFVKNGYTV